MMLSDGTHTFRIRTQFLRSTHTGRPAGPLTQVSIEVKPDVWLSRTTRCSPHDQFVKETGRRIALGRVLRDAGFSKEQRTVLWSSYFSGPLYTAATCPGRPCSPQCGHRGSPRAK